MRYLVLFILSIGQVHALVTCPAPADCNPGCDETCTYHTCSQEAVTSFVLEILPTKYVSPSNACQDTLEGFVITSIPFSTDGQVYNSMKSTVSHKYKICQAHSKQGEPCPPPPDSLSP